MTYWDDGHMDRGWGPFVMLLMMLLVLALIGFVAWWAVRDARPARPAVSARPSAEQVLADRLARGEIDVSEYRSRLEALRSSDVVP